MCFGLTHIKLIKKLTQKLNKKTFTSMKSYMKNVDFIIYDDSIFISKVCGILTLMSHGKKV